MIDLLAKAYKRGLWSSLAWLFWKIKFAIFSACGVKEVTSKYQVKLAANYPDITFRFYFFGSYGYYLSDILRSQTKEFSFIDVGANQGLYSILAGKNPHCKSVLSFEPIDETYDFLTRNIAINSVGDTCRAFKKAIDNVAETKEINFDSSHTGVTTLAGEHVSTGSMKEIETVDCNFLNEVFSDLNEDVFLKVDVEGYEQTVLNELFKAEKSSLIRGVFYEVDVQWVDPAELEALLRTHGFTHFEKIGVSDTHYDIFATK